MDNDKWVSDWWVVLRLVGDMRGERVAIFHPEQVAGLIGLCRKTADALYNTQQAYPDLFGLKGPVNLDGMIAVDDVVVMSRDRDWEEGLELVGYHRLDEDWFCVCRNVDLPDSSIDGAFWLRVATHVGFAEVEFSPDDWPDKSQGEFPYIAIDNLMSHVR